MACGTSLGHEDCGIRFADDEREGHKSAPDSWQRSKNLVYRRKIKAQKGKK